MIVEQLIGLDINRRNTYVYAKQADNKGRVLRVQLMDGDKPIEIPSGSNITLRAEKPDGTYAVNNGSRNSDGTASIALTDQVLAVEGLVLADVSVTLNGETISSATFGIKVGKVPSGSAVTSSNEFLQLETLISQAQSLITNYVSTQPQSLSDAQKAQVKTNIGVKEYTAGSNISISSTGVISGTAQYDDTTIQKEVNQLKNDLVTLCNSEYEDVSNVSVNSTSDGWSLIGNGFCKSDSSSCMDKYKVDAGKMYHLVLAKNNDGVYQWQSESSVPGSESTPHLIGTPVKTATNGYYIAPTGAKYLIVSRYKTTSTNTVSIAEAKTKALIDTVNGITEDVHALCEEVNEYEASGTLASDGYIVKNIRVFKGTTVKITNNSNRNVTVNMGNDDSLDYIGNAGANKTVTFVASSDYTYYKGYTSAGDYDIQFTCTNNLQKSASESKNNVLNLIKSSKSMVYVGSDSSLTWEKGTNGAIILRIGSDLNIKRASDSENETTTISQAQIVEMLGSRAEISGSVCSITIPYYYNLCFDFDSNKLAIVSFRNIKSNHFVLASNGWSNPYGALIDVANRKAITNINTSIDEINKKLDGTDDYISKFEDFANLMYGDSKVSGHTAPTEFENFVFFTDPHTMYGKYTSEEKTIACKYFDKYIDDIKYAYDSTPTDFVLCGGDWNDAGIPKEELFKLSRANEICKNNLAPFYNIVGNHDTNMQGKATSESESYTSLFTPACLKDLWFRDKENCYYTFDGIKTRFYIFDTRTGEQSLSGENNYLENQLLWFINKLKSDNSQHIALAMHVYYSTGTTIFGFAEWIMKVACAYNARGTISYNDVSHDFSSSTGKVEVAIVGHTHADFITSYQHSGKSIPVIGTINAGNSNGSESSYYGATHAIFDLVNINYDDRTINMVRVGARGSDRTTSLSS